MLEKYKEGQVTFLSPPIQKVPTTGMQVFYNPQSELNRDITICVIQAFLNHYEKTDARVCTPLAGTGVRAIRIAKEVDRIKSVVAGDCNPIAAELIKRNSELNRVSEIIEVHHSDANLLLTRHHHRSRKFDIIDIDPFGSPRNFFAAAIGAIKSHGLLCLTATDIPVLVGIRPKACMKRYAANPARTEYGHELAIRLLLGSAVREAASQDIGLKPLLAFYADHYIRVFCYASKGDEAAWAAISQLGHLVHCDECGFRQLTNKFQHFQPSCPKCDSKRTQIAGPLWANSLGSRVFIDGALKESLQKPLGTKRRLTRLLKRLLKELDGPPTYFDLHKLCDELEIPIPSFQSVMRTLRDKGHFCSRTHFSPHAIRTSASAQTLHQTLMQITEDEKHHV
ncbi:MAG: tRNA (guanine(10)-N(2))-dimethyltransferase [Promethearchaeota archaeon]